MPMQAVTHTVNLGFAVLGTNMSDSHRTFKLERMH